MILTKCFRNQSLRLMKRLKNFFTIILVLFALASFGQSPEHINYQAVLRNTSTGVELQNQPVYMVVKFLEDGPTGDIVYQEEHANVQTNAFGLINILLGDGTPIVGNFTDIPWISGHIWLSLEVDSGDGLQPVGTTEFSSVPYALFAASANSEPDGDGDSTNEIQNLSLLENTLTITNNPSATEIDLSRFVNPAPDGDGDSTNEIQDLSLSGNTLTITNNESATPINLSPYVNNPVDEIQDLSLSGNTLTITNNDSATPIDLSPYVNNPADEIQDLSLSENTLTITNNDSATPIDLSPYVNVPDGDSDPTNELITSFTYNTETGIMELQEGGVTYTHDLSGLAGGTPDGDGSPTNEIQDLELTGTTLKITNNPSPTEIDLGQFVNNPNDEIQDLSISGDKLTITNNASATEIDLSPYVNPDPDGDGDSTNEIQDLSISGNTLTITNNASATEIDLSGFVSNPDDEIQDLSLFWKYIDNHKQCFCNRNRPKWFCKQSR